MEDQHIYLTATNDTCMVRDKNMGVYRAMSKDTAMCRGTRDIGC